MPGTSRAKHPSGVEIEFAESTHKYTSFIDNELVTYVSGTQFIHKFFPPFDADGEIAKRCALKEGVSVEEIQARWSKAGKEACILGTRVHECCEDIENGAKELRNSPQDEREAKLFENATSMAKRFYDNLDILGVEKIVFSPSLKIAGTIDLLARSRKTGDFILIDHKTNKSIDKIDKWNNFAFKPIEHLHNINFNVYSLQLNLYQYLLKHEGYIPKNAKFTMVLNHISEIKAELISVPDMQNEIKDMIIEYLSIEAGNH